MGIKGIYGEIGPGKRISLVKLAIENFERTGRPLRIAIDTSIWKFQIQSGKGGQSPALRTFYYRLLRLMVMSIQPLFVFDGSNKPPFKRNKATGSNSKTLEDRMVIRLLELFGFPYHNAPGEAEAECALLQREGVVDAVLSEDVDTIMFGCGTTFRNWSREGSSGPPTHVSVYDAKEGLSGLDRDGMILIALMSGGDYITEGIPGCGMKVACEAARAGFGKSLCRLSRTNNEGIEGWRRELAYQIQHNEKKYFRVRHRTLKIPDTFPNKEVLGYYTDPAVSSTAEVAKLKEEIYWDREADIASLREFVADVFGWSYKAGARKFIRGIAPALLVSKLRASGGSRVSASKDFATPSGTEPVKAICGRRAQFSTDGIPELRLIYNPAEIVGLSLDADADEDIYARGLLSNLGDDEDEELYQSGDERYSRIRSASPTKRGPSAFDPSEPAKVWVPEVIAKAGVPVRVDEYEKSQFISKKAFKPKHGVKKTIIKSGMPNGAMDRYITIVKPSMASRNSQSMQASKIAMGQPSSQPDFSPLCLAPTLDKSTPFQSTTALNTAQSSRSGHSQQQENVGWTQRCRLAPVHYLKARPKGTVARPTNPWTLTQLSSPPSTSRAPAPRISRPSIHRRITSQQKNSIQNRKDDAVIIDSSSPGVFRTYSFSSIFIPNSASPEVQTTSRPVSPGIPAVEHGQDILTETESDRNNTPCTSPMNNNSPVPLSPDADLPFLEDLLNMAPLPARRIETRSVPFSATKEVAQNEGKRGRGEKRFLMLRDSLEGAWKEVYEDELSSRPESGRRAWRLSEVEVLDMT